VSSEFGGQGHISAFLMKDNVQMYQMFKYIIKCHCIVINEGFKNMTSRQDTGLKVTVQNKF
jgi:hypothetical protein